MSKCGDNTLCEIALRFVTQYVTCYIIFNDQNITIAILQMDYEQSVTIIPLKYFTLKNSFINTRSKFKFYFIIKSWFNFVFSSYFCV